MRFAGAAALVFAAHAACAQGAPPEAVKELAPTGTLRAAINYGNGVLAQKGADGPQGISADLSRELAKRLGVQLALRHVRGRRQGVRGREGERGRRAVRRDRAGARRRCRLLAALCADRRHLHGAEGLAAEGSRRRRPRRHARRDRARLGLRSLSHPHLEERHSGARRDRRMLRDDRSVPRREARGGRGRAPAAGRIREVARGRARDGRPLPGNPPGDGHAERPAGGGGLSARASSKT